MKIKNLLEAYKKIRGVWAICPATKIKNSKKKYNRNKEKKNFKKHISEEI